MTNKWCLHVVVFLMGKSCFQGISIVDDRRNTRSGFSGADEVAEMQNDSGSGDFNILTSNRNPGN